ncbi:MAG: hypothetical protein HLUCCO15_13465 [Erythrobacteraceae bacterium HL-111]|nr:MAG: hypothetical protein HLUCCO15_13465 [Erythrobacteraceae bacterium HL-111]
MTTRFLAPALALFALAQASAAEARQACAAPRDIDDAMTYAMPLAFEATRAACGTTLQRDGFLAREGDRLVGPLTAVWFVVFVIPLVLFTPDVARADFTDNSALAIGLKVAYTY